MSLQGFRSITQTATQTFAAVRQLTNTPTQTFAGVGSLSATGPAVGFQTYTTDNGIKVYVGPFANAYAYFGLTPPNMHTAEMVGQVNNTRAGENTINTRVTDTTNTPVPTDMSSVSMSSGLTDTANTSASADGEPVTPPRSQGRALSPSPAYSPILTPVSGLQQLANPQKKTEISNKPKSEKSQKQVKATGECGKPITPTLEVQQLPNTQRRPVAPEKAKTDVKGKGNAKQIDTGLETAAFDLAGTKSTRAPRAQPEATAATGKGVTIPAAAAAVVATEKVIEQEQVGKSMTADTPVVKTTMPKPESDVEQVKKWGKIVQNQRVGTQPSQISTSIESLQEPEVAKNTTLDGKPAKGINTSQPVTTRTTRSRANTVTTRHTVPKARSRARTESEAPGAEGSSSRRSSGRASFTPRPWWVAGSSPVTVAPVRMKSESVQPPSMNRKRKRSALNEEQNEQGTEQHARKSRKRHSASGSAQSDSVRHPSLNRNAQEEKASTRAGQAIQDQMIDVVIQEHDATTTANGPDDKSIKSEGESEYHHQITSIQENHSSGTTTSANNSENEAIKNEDESVDEYGHNHDITSYHGLVTTTSASDSENETKSADEYLRNNPREVAIAVYDSENDEYELYQTSDGLDDMGEEEEPDDDIVFQGVQANNVSGEGSFKDEVSESEILDENNWEQGIEYESIQQQDRDELVDYDDLPQSPQRPNYPRIRLYPLSQANYDVTYDEDDSPEYPNYMRKRARRRDYSDAQSRSLQYSEGEYQPQDSENKYQPQDLDDDFDGYSDLPKNPFFRDEYQEDEYQGEQWDGNLGDSDELPLNYHYHPGVRGAIFDSSSSDPFQSPDRGRTLLQGTRRAWTGLSPMGPRETPPPRQPSTSPRKRKRLLWRENGQEELIHPDSPRYLSFPQNAPSSPGRGRTLLQGTRRAWTGLSPMGPRETPPPREPSSSPRPRKRVRHLYRQGGVDKFTVPPSSPIYAIGTPSGSLPEEYDGAHQQIEREMNETSYVNLVSDSSDPDTPLPPTPPPRVWPKSNVMGKRNFKKRAPMNPLKPSSNGVSKPTDKRANNVHKSNGNSVSPVGRPSPETAEPPSLPDSALGLPQAAVEPGSNVMVKYNLRRSRAVEAKNEKEEVKSHGAPGSSTTSKPKVRKTHQPASPKSTRVTRSGAIGKIAGRGAAKRRGKN